MGFLDECMNRYFEGGATRSQNSAGLGTFWFKTILVAWVGKELTMCCGTIWAENHYHQEFCSWRVITTGSVDFSLFLTEGGDRKSCKMLPECPATPSASCMQSCPNCIWSQERWGGIPGGNSVYTAMGMPLSWSEKNIFAKPWPNLKLKLRLAWPWGM